MATPSPSPSPALGDLYKAKEAATERWLKPSPARSPQQRIRTLRLADALAGGTAANVHGIGIGRKVVSGERSGSWCIRFYVAQKIPLEVLPEAEGIPANVEGLPTDVIQTPPAFFLGAAPAVPSGCSASRTSRQRPIVAGISSAHYRVTAGTLGYFCRSTLPGDDTGKIFLLSNNHVFGNLDAAQPGDAIYQQAPLDGGTAADRVGAFSRCVPIRLGGNDPNRVDAAIAELLLETADHRVEICTIGRVASPTTAAEGQHVCKHGRTTAYTVGEVTDISVNQLIGVDPQNPIVLARFDNQIRIEPLDPPQVFAEGGDSGALVVEQSTRGAVGLLFAAPLGGSYALANPIEEVLRELRVNLLGEFAL